DGGKKCRRCAGFPINATCYPVTIKLAWQGSGWRKNADDLGIIVGGKRHCAMGGSGSGNCYHWWRPSKKTAVEDCRQLDANEWMREGILKAETLQIGGWGWFRDAARTEQTSSIGYEVDTCDPGGPWVRLFYTITASQEKVDYRVRLATTRPRFG